MSRNLQWNVVLGAVVVISVFLIQSGGRDLSQTNVEYMPDMAYAISYQSFNVNPVFSDGRTLQSPPDGVVARGRIPLGFGTGESEARRAAQELHSPFDLAEPGLRQDGARRFATFCQPCHGATGAGDGLIPQRGYPPPPSLTAAHAREIADGQMFHIISRGQGNMPGHASQIARDDRWGIVAHLRELQEKISIPAPADEPSDSASVGGGS
jgi:mono/diheme cytochrome c family protein